MTQLVPRFFRRVILSPLVFLGLAWALSHTVVLRDLEWKSLDLRTRYRALFQPPPDERIVIALFEDGTNSEMVNWPPDRQWHGNFNELLSLVGTALVSWDVILDASREGEGDRAMALGIQAARERGTEVVLAAALSEDQVEVLPSGEGPTKPIANIEGPREALTGDAHALIPFPEIREVAAYGFADARRGRDGVIREVPMLIRLGEDVYPSLALQTLLRYLAVPTEQVRAKLGEAVVFQAQGREWRIPIDAAGKYLVNYRYETTREPEARWDGEFPMYSYQELFLLINAHVIEKVPDARPPPDLAGKIVFVGQTVTGWADAGPTPRAAYSALVLMHANIVNNVLAGDFVRRVPEWLVWVLGLVLSYVAVMIGARYSALLMGGIAVLGVVSYTTACLGAWMAGSVLLPWVGPMLGFGGLQFYVIGRRVLQEQRAKQEIKGMFGAYVSPHVVDQLIKSHEPPRLGGHAAEITAFFSDIEGFSSFSEKLSPERLVELMNEYLTACTDVVQAEGGTLDKYIGDAIVAMFGAPIPQPDHAYRACVATCRVQTRVAELRAKWRAEGPKWPESVWRLRTRIGLNTGACIIGNMGSRTRFNYTMMGDDVNLAARMESGAKTWGVYTMCTEATKLACERHGPDRVVFRALGRIVVKGRSKAVPIYEIVGLKETTTPETRECLKVFAEGLTRFYDRDWDGAIDRFRRSAALELHRPVEGSGITSNPSLVFIHHAEHFRVAPPPADWDGVHVMQEK